MKLNELKKIEAKPQLPLGKNEITFTGFKWLFAEDENVKGGFIQSDEYRDIYIHFFDENPFVFCDLCNQLEISNIGDLSKAKTAKVIITKYKSKSNGQDYENVSLNPEFDFDKAMARYELSV